MKAILRRDQSLGKQDIQDIQVLASSAEIDQLYLNKRIDLTLSRGWVDDFLVQLQILK